MAVFLHVNKVIMHANIILLDVDIIDRKNNFHTGTDVCHHKNLFKKKILKNYCNKLFDVNMQH